LEGRCISRIYFEDYEKILNSADIIFIPQKFEYRVSGVFYEAIANENSIIVMSKCTYSKSMKSIFGDSIVMLEDLEDLNECLSSPIMTVNDFNRRKSLIEQVENRSKANLKREFYV
jgi:hypothetical protein